MSVLLAKAKDFSTTSTNGTTICRSRISPCFFEGQITHQVMKALTGLVEEQLDDVEDDKVLRRVYHVMVESLQNINRHAEAYEYRGHPYPGMGLVLVAKNQ